MSNKNTERSFIAGLLFEPTRIPEVVELVPVAAITDKYSVFVYNQIIRRFNKGKLTDHDVLDRMIHSKRSSNGVRKDISKFALWLQTVKCPSREGFNYLKQVILDSYKRTLMLDKLIGVTKYMNDNKMSKARNEIMRLANQLEDKAHEGKIGRLTLDTPQRVRRNLILAEQDESERYPTGYNKLDELTGGGKRGDLWLVCAYTGEGKTSMQIEFAYRSWIRGKNVVFVSLEMSREEVELLLTVRHAHAISPGGIDKKRAEEGRLSKRDKKIFLKTLKDLSRREKGEIYIWQTPEGLTMQSLKGKLETVQHEFDINLVCIDYLELMDSPSKSREHRIRITETIKASKQLARTFNNGRGIWIVSGHQTSSDGREKAEKRGYYVLKGLAETAGAARTANVILCLLQTDEQLSNHEILLSIPKNRSGRKLMKGYLLMADFAHGIIEEISEELWDSNKE